jgi:hypothetical protein
MLLQHGARLYSMRIGKEVRTMCLNQMYYDEAEEEKRRKEAAQSQPKPQETPKPRTAPEATPV